MFIASSNLLKQVGLNANKINISLNRKTPFFITPRSLTQINKFSYHMSYLMDSKHDERFVKIDKKAFSLYFDSIINFPNQPFSQKRFILIYIDCVRTKQDYQYFQKLTKVGINNLHNIKELLSIFSIATQLYLYNYQDRQQCYLVAKRGFQLIKQNSNIRIPSFHMMKFLIFIEKNVGLQRFTNEDYVTINFNKFKPLFLCFTLELFYYNNLRQQYRFIQHLFKLFLECEEIIPFADIHHYKLIQKKMNDPQFSQYLERLIGKVSSWNQSSGNKKISLLEEGENEQNQPAQTSQNIKGENSIAVNKQNTQIQSNKVRLNQLNTQKQTHSRRQSTTKPYDWDSAYKTTVLHRQTFYPVFSSESLYGKKQTLSKNKK